VGSSGDQSKENQGGKNKRRKRQKKKQEKDGKKRWKNKRTIEVKRIAEEWEV